MLKFFRKKPHNFLDMPFKTQVGLPTSHKLEIANMENACALSNLIAIVYFESVILG